MVDFRELFLEAFCSQGFSAFLVIWLFGLAFIFFIEKAKFFQICAIIGLGYLVVWVVLWRIR